MEEAIQAILGTGGFAGAILVVLGAAYWQQGRELRQSYEARIADAQKVATAALEREEKWQEALGDLTKAIENLLDRSNRRNP